MHQLTPFPQHILPVPIYLPSLQPIISYQIYTWLYTYVPPLASKSNELDLLSLCRMLIALNELGIWTEQNTIAED